jgi:hypothetical protein
LSLLLPLGDIHSATGHDSGGGGTGKKLHWDIKSS